MFPKLAKPVASDLHLFIQSSWRNRIGLLRWRRGLGTTGTGNWACNIINNTVNTTVQQCIHNSMITMCLVFLNKSNQFRKQVQFHLVLPRRKHSISLRTLHQVTFHCRLWHGRKGTPFMTQP